MWSGLLLAGLVLSATPPVQLRTLTGDSHAGSMTTISDSEIVIGTEKIATREVERISVGSAAAIPQGSLSVELVDGSVLISPTYQVSAGKAKLNLGGQEVEIDIQHVVAVRFRADTKDLLEDWGRIRGMQAAADVLVLQKADALDYLEGLFSDVSDERIQFELDGEVIPVNRKKAYGMIYFQKAGRALAKPTGTVVLTNGSRIPARNFELAGANLVFTTPAGAKLSVPLSGTSAIDFAEGKIAFLSDLVPLSIKVTPFFDLAIEPRFNTNLGGGKLKLGSSEYERGISLHSKTEIVYHLGGKYSRFEAIVGIDEAVGNRGHAELTIRGDERQLFAAPVAGSDEPKKLELNVQGVQRLYILVDFGKDLDVSDHVDLCEAKVIQ